MSKPMNAQFFRPFVDGTIKTLKVSCSTDATPGKPFIKGTQKQPSFDIAGVIGLASPTFTGNITLCFTSQLYLTLMEKMLGEKYTEITDELQDGAAELLNQVFGHAKVVLNQEGHKLDKAIPAVIRGTNLRTTFLGKGKVIVLPFETTAGELHIEIAAENT